jgi:hypothetical protein
MKTTLLFTVLFLLAVVSLGYANPLPAPDEVDATTGASADWDGEWGEGDTIHCPACGAENPFYSRFCVSCGVEMATWVAEVEPTKHYSWEAGLFGNLIPGLGYFLIEETWWGVAEIGLCGAGVLLLKVGEGIHDGFLNGLGEMYAGAMILGISYIAGLIHAPLLAEYKNEQQKVALDLTPGLGLDSSGEVYPTLQLTLSF